MFIVDTIFLVVSQSFQIFSGFFNLISWHVFFYQSVQWQHLVLTQINFCQNVIYMMRLFLILESSSLVLEDGTVYSLEQLNPKANSQPFFRQCPGKYFADTNIWLALTSMIAMLNIEKDVSMIPDVKFENGFSRHPAPFSCRISARCEKLVAMINHITA